MQAVASHWMADRRSMVQIDHPGQEAQCAVFQGKTLTGPPRVTSSQPLQMEPDSRVVGARGLHLQARSRKESHPGGWLSLVRWQKQALGLLWVDKEAPDPEESGG